MSKDYPAQWGRSPQYHNPSGTLPAPAPQDMPVTFWQQTATRVDWSAGVAVTPAADARPAGTDFTFSWKGPTFDLRPDLRSSQGEAKGGVPIWSRSARLYFQLNMTTQVPPVMQNMQIRLQHYGNVQLNIEQSPSQGPSVVPISSQIIVTNSFMFATGLDQTPVPGSLVAAIAPPGTAAGGGEGYPIRYWRPLLTFTKYFETSEFPAPTPPVISVQAVYY